jgi:hypothetical protein
MSREIKIGLGLLAAVIIAGLAGLFWPQIREDYLVRQCYTAESIDASVDCWFGLLEQKTLSRGVGEAMKLFTKIYREYPEFSDTGCHRYAHRMGDIVYYNVYREYNDITKMEFPQETTACGYGFFHGFLEHLIQDRPDPGFVGDTCDYLHDTYGATMGDVRTICYHGSGHGFTLAQVEKVPQSRWGDVYAFATEPVKQCDALTRATGQEQEECRQGVFNVIVDWMEDENFGFIYNKEDPFQLCRQIPSAWQHACYYEMAQKLDGVTNRDAEKLVAIADSIQSPEYRILSFRVGIAGFIQNVVSTNRYLEFARTCSGLDSECGEACILSLVNGLFEHGEPQREYVKAHELCSSDAVTDQYRPGCWDSYVQRLPRFYTAEVRAELCMNVPPEYQEECRSPRKEG